MYRAGKLNSGRQSYLLAPTVQSYKAQEDKQHLPPANIESFPDRRAHTLRIE